MLGFSPQLGQYDWGDQSQILIESMSSQQHHGL